MTSYIFSRVKRILIYAYILMGDLFSDELSELTSYPDDELTGYYCTYEISESPKFRVRPEIP